MNAATGRSSRMRTPMRVPSSPLPYEPWADGASELREPATALRARGMFPLPVVSSFRELNVRTYVTDGEKPGIWFFSLDASSALAAEAARRLYKRPYFRADITLERRAGRIFYECVRDEKSAFSGSYKAAGAAFQAEATSLEHFLTERYCLYAAERGRLYRAEIHHRPWALRPAEATIDLN